MEAPKKTARDKGVVYLYPDGTEIFVKGREHRSVDISIQHNHKRIGGKGGLHKAPFREELVEDAGNIFGERNGLGGYLSYIAENFDEDRARGQEIGSEDYPEAFSGAGYVVSGGGFAYKKKGDDNVIPLTNFTAKIVADTDLDGGPSLEPTREYTVEAWIGGRSLGKHRVDATRFDSMSWVPLKLGSQARVMPGYGGAGKAADAIKAYSDDTVIKKVFTSTGYADVDGEMIYLHEGLENPEVRLSKALSDHYRLPLDPTLEEIREGIALSYRLWSIAPDWVSIPITACAYVAPLASTLNTNFLPYIYGPTGSLKTTKSALVNSHFGDFTPDNMPLNFEATANFTERALYDAKDALAVVDDLRPGHGTRDKETMEQRLQILARVVGNHTGKGRMRSDLANRESFDCRSMVMATGEYLPGNISFRSAEARMLAIRVDANTINFDEVREIAPQTGKLACATAGYTKWLASRLESVNALHTELYEEFSRFEVKRLPMALSKLLTGVVLFGEYAVSAGAITEEEAAAYRKRAKDAILRAGRRHADSMNANDPAVRFLEELKSGLDAGRLYLKDRSTEKHPAQWERFGWRSRDVNDDREEISPVPGAKFVGWVDKNAFYLEPGSAVGALEKELSNLNRSVISGALLDKGKLVKVSKGRDTASVQINSGASATSARVWKIARTTVDGPLPSRTPEDCSDEFSGP